MEQIDNFDWIAYLDNNPDLKDNYINLNGYNTYWHFEAKVPWLYNPITQIMITYDDEESIEQKASYIIEQDIGGAMFWEFSGDKFSDLLNQVNDVFNSESSNENIGDLNNDAMVNIIDVVILVNHILNPEIVELDSADINNDGNVNILDVVLLIDIILNE